MLTQTAKYAIKTVHYLAQQDLNSFVQTRDLGETLSIPSNYLGKTLQKLARARILESQKGLHGGFRCERHPSKITLHEVLSVIEALPEIAAAMSDDGLPPLFHAKFTQVQQAYDQFLRQTTIADLIEAASPVSTPTPTPADQAPIVDQVAEALMDS